jgi:hypothetical protein
MHVVGRFRRQTGFAALAALIALAGCARGGGTSAPSPAAAIAAAAARARAALAAVGADLAPVAAVPGSRALAAGGGTVRVGEKLAMALSPAGLAEAIAYESARISPNARISGALLRAAAARGLLDPAAATAGLGPEGPEPLAEAAVVAWLLDPCPVWPELADALVEPDSAVPADGVAAADALLLAGLVGALADPLVAEALTAPVSGPPPASIDEAPVVIPLANLYQENACFAPLFGAGGESALCGPTSLANVLLYLRGARPGFPALFPGAVSPTAAVDALFRLCGTDPGAGTTLAGLDAGAVASVVAGGYSAAGTRVRGVHAGDEAAREPLSGAELRAGFDTGAVAVLLFGWYDVDWLPAERTWAYRRVGGHYVALAGYDAADAAALYVADPLEDYGAAPCRTRIRLTAVPDRPDVRAPQGIAGLLETGELVGGHRAVLEDALVIVVGRPAASP